MCFSIIVCPLEQVTHVMDGCKSPISGRYNKKITDRLTHPYKLLTHLLINPYTINAYPQCEHTPTWFVHKIDVLCFSAHMSGSGDSMSKKR